MITYQSKQKKLLITNPNIMKVQLQFKQTKNAKFGYNETQLAKIKQVDEEWNYVKFLKQEGDLVERISSVIIELPDTLV